MSEFMATYVAFPKEADLTAIKEDFKNRIRALDLSDERTWREVVNYFYEAQHGDYPEGTAEETKTAMLAIIDEFFDCLNGPEVDTLLHKGEYLYVTYRNPDEENAYDCFTRYILMEAYFGPTDG